MTPDERYKFISEQLVNEIYGGDLIFKTAMERLVKENYVSDETLEYLCGLIRKGLHRNQKAFLRHALKFGGDEKIARYCRYVSLSSDGVPKMEQVAIASLISRIDKGLFDHALENVEQRVGLAHAIAELKLTRHGLFGKNAAEVIEMCPGVLGVFARNPGMEVDLHRFIGERELVLTRPSDVAVLQEYASSSSRALASGSL